MSSIDQQVRLGQDIANRLVERRLALGYSVEEMAKRANVSPSVIHALESDGGVGLGGVYARAYLHRCLAVLEIEVNIDDLVRDPALQSASIIAKRIPSKKAWERLKTARRRMLSGLGVGVAICLIVVVFSPPDLTFFSESLQQQSAHGGVEVRQIEPRELMRYIVNSSDQGEGLIDPTLDGASASLIQADSAMAPTYVIGVRMHYDGWLELKDATGKQLEHDLLRAATDRSYQGEPPFEFLLGRAGAAELSLNGQRVMQPTDAVALDNVREAGGVVRLILAADGSVSEWP